MPSQKQLNFVLRSLSLGLILTACIFGLALIARAQVSPSPTPSITPFASPLPTPTPTVPPIELQPNNTQVPVGQTSSVFVNGAFGNVTIVIANPAILGAALDSSGQHLTISGKAPGSTTVTATDARGVSAMVAVRVAFLAGTIPSSVQVRLTGNPASPEFIREQVIAAVEHQLVLQPNAQVIISASDLAIDHPLRQDDSLLTMLPVMLQGDAYFDAQGTVRVEVDNLAAPQLPAHSLMISDFPERLLHDGVLFSSTLQARRPSRFLYFHYNPPGQIARRIVLRAVNTSAEPTLVQFIEGKDGPSPNEMAVGHTATKNFLVHLARGEGRVIQIPGNGSVELVEQELTPGSIVCNLMQLRVIEGGRVNLTLFAQSLNADPNALPSLLTQLDGTHAHARGVYPIPDFYYETSWSVDDPYLELPVGQIPLPNLSVGRALAGDYGVLQTFQVTIQNPSMQPQAIAIYENPRGGRATGTYVIDGTLVQSHQVPPYSRYKIRQYIIPARGFVRVSIQTIPEGGSSYPLRLIFAPDDGSVAPGAPGSPVY